MKSPNDPDPILLVVAVFIGVALLLLAKWYLWGTGATTAALTGAVMALWGAAILYKQAKANLDDR